jgi:hypothetical protein
MLASCPASMTTWQQACQLASKHDGWPACWQVNASPSDFQNAAALCEARQQPICRTFRSFCGIVCKRGRRRVLQSAPKARLP